LDRKYQISIGTFFDHMDTPSLDVVDVLEYHLLDSHSLQLRFKKKTEALVNL